MYPPSQRFLDQLAFPFTARSTPDSTEWKLVADDFSYALWHRPTTKHVILDLARRFEILTFSVGDSDQAYDLRHFVDGDLVRELIVDDCFGGGDQRILVDDGKRIPGELDPLGQDNLVRYLSTLAAASGFDVRDGLATSRVWIDKSPRSRVSSEDETRRRTRSWKRVQANQGGDPKIERRAENPPRTRPVLLPNTRATAFG